MPQVQLATQDAVITAAVGTAAHVKVLSEQRQFGQSAEAAAGTEQQHCGSYHYHQQQEEP